ncbi:hypothetical protein RQP54_05035 [Curvibacter sp. APW13]|uniref:hypothetical protein n=1 Tax=Curvibacter sp. APW13 TaxID=3077236 RepID=UPI0028DDBB86|nr:hypothetical protein [Curvibacter sp. APW13]MDT8990223.1 hypothetical protein [Curvibacter sp. APW13]
MARTVSVGGGRMVEWAILALVVLGFVWVFGLYASRVHGQAERAAVMTTLGTMRTAMVLEHLQVQVRGQASAAPESSANPFTAMGAFPPNYAGEVQGRDLSQVAPGQWAFDGQCRCIGYKPLYATGLESKDGLDALWFQSRAQAGVGTLVPLDRYVWLGMAVE